VSIKSILVLQRLIIAIGKIEKLFFGKEKKLSWLVIMMQAI